MKESIAGGASQLMMTDRLCLLLSAAAAREDEEDARSFLSSASDMLSTHPPEQAGATGNTYSKVRTYAVTYRHQVCFSIGQLELPLFLTALHRIAKSS